MRTEKQTSQLHETTPWAGMTSADVQALIARAGSIEAATDEMLSWGHSRNFEKNKRFRETVLEGRGIDEDRDDLSSGFSIVAKRRRGGAARSATIDEWNAILALYPKDGRHRDVLTLSAKHGFGEVDKIAKVVGRTERRVRQIQDWLWAWATKNLDSAVIVTRLDDPITTEAVGRRPPSKAGRKPKGRVTAQAAQDQCPQVEPFGDVVAWTPGKPRDVPGPCRPCPAPTIGGQVAVLREAA